MEELAVGDLIHYDEKSGTINSVDQKNRYLVATIDGKSETIVFDEWPYFEIVKPGGDDDELRLKMARAKFKHFTIRRAKFVYEKIGYNNNTFFYGYTTANRLMNLEYSNPNHIRVYDDSLYFQAGNCCKLRLSEGLIEFEDDIYNELIKIPRGGIMLGIPKIGDRGQKYDKWCYVGNGRKKGLYYLYLIMTYGLEHNAFRNMKKEQIMTLLENDTNRAYVSTLIYKENCDLSEKIKSNLTWALNNVL